MGGLIFCLGVADKEMQGAGAFGGTQPLDVGLSSPELRPQICVPVFGSGFTHGDVPDAAKGAEWP